MKKIIAILKQADKKMHMMASYAIALTAFVLGLIFSFGGWSVPFAVAVAALVGYGKELGDKYCWKCGFEVSSTANTAMAVVYAPKTTPPSYGASCFRPAKVSAVYVPSESVSSYKSSWSALSSKIQANPT